MCGADVLVHVGSRVLPIGSLIDELANAKSSSGSLDMVLDHDYIAIIQQLRTSTRRRNLQDLLALTRYSVSTDARDAVYAKIGIAEDGTNVFGAPDYNLSITAILKKLALGMMEAHDNLRFLCYVEKANHGLPTWVPDWYVPIPCGEIKSMTNCCRTRWEHTLSMTESGCARSRQVSTRRFYVSQNDRVLYAQGMMISTLSEREHSAETQTSITEDSMLVLISIVRTLLVHHPYYANSMPDFARILARRGATIDASSCSPSLDELSEADRQWLQYDTWYRLHRETLVHGWPVYHWIAKLQLQGSLQLDNERLLEMLERWSQARIQLYLTNRRLSTLADGSPALVPRRSQTGDLICVLFDCAHPVVLRKIGDRLTFVGHCYVDSLHEVENWDKLCRPGVPETTFSIH